MILMWQRWEQHQHSGEYRPLANSKLEIIRTLGSILGACASFASLIILIIHYYL